MALSREPDPDAILVEIEQTLALLHSAIEQCVVLALQTLQQGGGLPYDGTGHATLFRLHLRQFLQGGPWENIDVCDLGNCGVLIRIPGYEFRVLKSSNDGGPPIPADSTPLLRFFNQVMAWQPHLPGFSDWFIGKDKERDVPLHLILHWHTNHRGEFIRARWACPKSATPYHAVWYFNRELPNPVLHLVVPEPDQDEQAASDDLGYTWRELPFTSGDESTDYTNEGDEPTT